MSIIKGVSIGDLHFGIRDSARLYKELKIFKDFIIENDIQLVVFNGDYFDKKLSIGDPESFYAFYFFKEIVDIVKSKNIILRMIQGTRSHDLNQLQAFKAYSDDTSINFRIIESVEEENLLGLQILYIPEEYPENSEEYYKDFKEKKFNIGFVHGTFDFVAQPGVIEIANRSTHSAPVLFWKEWKSAFEKGFVSAGHIHGRNTYGNKIFYPGSFSRWGYGERSDKGFTYFEYDLDNETYSVKYVDNTLAPKFDVIAVSDMELDLNSVTVNDIQKALDTVLEGTDNLRIDLAGLSDENIKILKEYYKDNNSVKIEVRSSKKSMLKESATIKNSEFEKYHYITKRMLPLNETIRKFCKEDLKKDITIEQINNVIGKDVDKNE